MPLGLFSHTLAGDGSWQLMVVSTPGNVAETNGSRGMARCHIAAQPPSAAGANSLC